MRWIHQPTATEVAPLVLMDGGAAPDTWGWLPLIFCVWVQRNLLYAASPLPTPSVVDAVSDAIALPLQ